MSIDIVEIALDTITDYDDFEKLASEIMKKEGYNRIKPLGGTKDLGRDAYEEKLFINKEKQTTVFQYSVQSEGINGKIIETIDKLIENDIDFNELVYVCPHKLSVQKQDSLKMNIRKNYGISLNIYDRKTIVNRLSDYDNGIFFRHFQDIENQLRNISSRKDTFYTTDDYIENSLLRAATAFAFSKDSENAKNSIFDQLTFIIIVNQDKAIDINRLAELYSAVEINKPDLDSINVSLKRLEINGLIIIKNGNISTSNKGIGKSKAIIIEVEESTNSLISDIVDKVCEVYEKELSLDEKNIIARNAKETLKEYFRLFGIEISNQFIVNKMPTAVYLDSTDSIIKLAKADLPSLVGEYLINTIADFIVNPSESHLETLVNWSLAYLGINVLNLDPTMNELESSCLGKKSFMLDTDFVLDCIVKECPISNIYRKIVQNLINKGCRIIIPEAVKNECISHAEFSGNTYNYFKDNLLGLSEDYLERLVWNVFVKGYYYANINDSISKNMSFKDYLDNYYNERKPGNYFEEVIKNIMPNGIEIINTTSLLTEELPEEMLTKMKNGLLNLLLRSKKAEYRSIEQNEELADTDARLFLTALYLNKDENLNENRIFGGICYLITSSSRYLRTAKALGIRDVISTRPQSVVSLLELVGQSTINNNELIKLFENPFLIYAVKESIDDVKKLIEKGIETRGKSVVRLRADLDDIFHSKLSLLDQLDKQSELFDDHELANDEVDNTLRLLEDAISKNYQLSPLIKSLYNRLKLKEKKVEDLELEVDGVEKYKKEIEDKISQFGKRKQKYIRKMLRRLNK